MWCIYHTYMVYDWVIFVNGNLCIIPKHLLNLYHNGGDKLSNINNGREVVLDFLEKNNITHQDLATAYGKKRSLVTNILNGSVTGTSANLFILELIRDYKIRGAKEGE